MNHVTVPMTEADARRLVVGDEVSLTGKLVTARDAAHKYLTDKHRGRLERVLSGSVIYHCGPVVQKDSKGRWRFTAAGPTTSIREEPYQGKVLADYGVRGVIGKGGMGSDTLDALGSHGAVYFHAVGGAAALFARCVEEVIEVHLLEKFGVPEAMWVIQVKSFPVVVTMDSHGRSLHAQVEEDSARKRAALLGL